MYDRRIQQGTAVINRLHQQQHVAQHQRPGRKQRSLIREGRQAIQDVAGRGEAVRLQQEQEYERALDKQKADLVRQGRQAIEQAKGYGKAQHLKLQQEKDRDVERFRMVDQGHRAEHEQADVREKMGLAKQASLQDKIQRGEQALHLQHTKGASLKTELEKQRRDASNAARLAGATERSLDDKIAQR